MSGGFRAIGKEGDGGYQGQLIECAVAAAHTTVLAPGDAVVITGTAIDQNNGRAIRTVDAAAASAAFFGIIASVKPNFTGENLTDIGLAALTAGNVMVQTDEDMLYDVEVGVAILAITDVGSNADIVATEATKSGSITQSNMKLAQDTVNTTATLQFRIVELRENTTADTLGNAVGTMGARAIVRANNTNAANSGGLGIA